MDTQGRAARIDLFSFSTPAMRAFHVTWVAFFLCFVAWFGIAPLMTVVRGELHLTKEQVGWCIIGSVAITILARLLFGWLCDRIGPRIAYTWLLILGSLPVMGIALAHDFTTFLLFRVMIGAIGASFVITQYHTSLMFAPRCVGTANAVTAGWGNLGGGVAQILMPLMLALFVTAFGVSESVGWRLSMVTLGITLIITGVAYYFLTQDTPEGNFRELRAAGKLEKKRSGGFLEACADHRVWALFLIYGACFGVELLIENIAVLYFVDYFPEFKAMSALDAAKWAGIIASGFGLVNIFARALGGYFGDRFGERAGFSGRVKWLFLVLFGEGLCLLVFSQITTLALAVPVFIVFALFVAMGCGATYAVVPFINRRALGSVSGIVGAGGNAGAVAAGFLFKVEGLDWRTALLILGAAVSASAFVAFAVTPRVEPVTETDRAEAGKLATATA
jgi:NNP family nitrate/nitrite transporter-like MFS transporter